MSKNRWAVIEENTDQLQIKSSGGAGSWVLFNACT